MGTLWQDVRYAARVMRRQPGFTAVAVLALALGVGATSAVFSVVNSVLLRPLPFEDSGRLVLISGTSPQNPTMFVSYPDFLDWREQQTSFEAISTLRGQSFNLTGGDEPERIEGRLVSAEFFDVMRVRLAAGRGFLPEEDKVGASPVVILGEGLWRRRFGGDPGVVGGEIVLDGRPYTVVGVMPEHFRLGGYGADVWAPFGQFVTSGWMTRDVRPGTRVVGRLKPGVSLEQAQAEMATIAARLEAAHPKMNAGVGARVESMYEAVVGETRAALWVLLGAVCFVLLIACANVANLQLARAASRRREFAVRSALGASRGRVVRQLLTESLLLALAGGALGLLFAVWGVDLLAAAGEGSVPRADEIRVDGRVLFFTFAVSLLTGVLFGLAPALQSARPRLHETLKEGAQAAGGTGGRRFGRALVVAEMALALVLLTGAGLLVKSFARLQEVSPGFDAERVLTMRVMLPRAKYQEDAQVTAFYRRLLERLAHLPGVEAAAVTNELPMRGRGWPVEVLATDRPVPPAGEALVCDWGIVSPDYFRALGIPVLRGRHFNEEDGAEAPRVVIVEEGLARHFWPGGDALGKQLYVVGPRPFEVMGVTGRVKSYGLDAESRPRVYVPAAQTPALQMGLVVRTSTEPGGMARAVAAEVRAVDPDQPVFDVRTMEDILAGSVAPRRFNAVLLGVFAASALALACIGIYGLISYAVAQRTHEIGVRMALGAQRGDVLRLVLRQGMTLALAGTGLGLMASLGLTRLMSGMLFGVTATDPLTFAAVAALLVAVALAACLVPARRATKVDPMVALRYE